MYIPQINEVVCVVTSPSKYARFHLEGKLGRVLRVYPSNPCKKANSAYNISVLFDEVYNSSSQNGCFWLSPEDIREATHEEVLEFEGEDEDENEKENTSMPFICSCVAQVSINESTRSYPAAVFGSDADNIKPGSLVLVKADKDNLIVAKVLSVDTYESPETVDTNGVEVAAVIDLSNFENRLKERARIAELKKSLDEEARKTKEINMYELMAQTNPAMKALLDEYKTLMGLK